MKSKTNSVKKTTSAKPQTQDMGQLLERLYTYKLLSFALSPNPQSDQLSQLKGSIRNAFTEQVPRQLTHLLQLIEELGSAENRQEYARQLGEMRDLEPIERKLVPQVNIGTVLADVAGFYKAFGLENTETLLIDHFSVEAEFMAHLLLKETYAMLVRNSEMEDVVRDAENKFLRDHLGRSAAYFTLLKQRVPNLAKVAKCGEVFLKGELKKYSILLSTPLPMLQEEPKDADIKCPID